MGLAVDLALGFADVILLMLILGVMRELVIARSEVTALSQLITRPPAPSYVGTVLPEAVVRKLKLIPGARREPQAILFLASGCGQCESLMSELAEAIHDGLLAAAGIHCIIAARSDSDPLVRSAAALSNVAVDLTGQVLQTAQVYGTPMQIAFWSDTFQVFSYKFGGDVEWLHLILTGETPEAKAG